MVRSLRAGLDEYMDPDLKRRMQAAAVDKAPSNTMQGLGFLLRKAMLGYDMGQDRKQRTAASGALTTGGKNQTKIIDAIKAQKAVEARPAMGEVSNQELYEMDAAPGGVNANRELYEQDGGWSNFEDAAPAMAAREASPEIKAQMARIDPNSGALYGRSQALAELLKTDPDNPYAQGALLDNAGQLSNRNANLQLNQLNNQNKLATIASNRAYSKLTLAEKREYDAKINAQKLLDDRETYEFEQKHKAFAPTAPKDTRTTLEKNLQARGLRPGTVEYQKAMEDALAKVKPYESSYNVARGKNLANHEQKVQETGAEAVKTNSYLNMAKTFVAVPKMLTSEMGLMVGTVAQKLGIPMPSGFKARVTNASAFNAMMMNILAQKLALQKGPQTETDAARMATTLATLGNTPKAKIFLINAARALNQRDIDKAAFYRNEIKTKGSSIGADNAWNDKIQDMPLFGTNSETKMPVFFEGYMKNNMAANVADRASRGLPPMPETEMRAGLLAKWKKDYGYK
jgi:hypothetical protein